MYGMTLTAMLPVHTAGGIGILIIRKRFPRYSGSKMIHKAEGWVRGANVLEGGGGSGCQPPPVDHGRRSRYTKHVANCAFIQ